MELDTPSAVRRSKAPRASGKLMLSNLLPSNPRSTFPRLDSRGRLSPREQ